MLCVCIIVMIRHRGNVQQQMKGLRKFYIFNLKNKGECSMVECGRVMLVLLSLFQEWKQQHQIRLFGYACVKQIIPSIRGQEALNC